MAIPRISVVLRTMALTVCVAASVSAQDATSDPTSKGADWPRGSIGDLRFFSDATAYRGVQGFALQEFYTVLDARQLQFVPETGNFVAQLDFSITITDASGQTAGEETWTRNFSVSNLREMKETGGVVRDQIGFSLKPGSYRVDLTVEDIYGDAHGTVEGSLEVEDFEASGLTSSGVLFASSIGRASGEGRFVRNGWEVVPRTTRIFKTGQPIPFYHELYNLSPGSDPGAFDVKYALLNEGGVPVGDPVTHRFKKGGESAVLIDSVATEGLAPGRYFFEVQSRDLDTKARTRRQTAVMLQSEEAASEELTDDQKTSLAYYRHIKWVAEEKDIKAYKALRRLDARDKFLKVFWKRLDPTPTTLLNEKLIEHIRRMRYADNNFSGAHKQEGYDTDKGRVYVKYGGPTDREYRSAVDNVKPYEIWTYQTQGTYEFIFRDRKGLGIYELVHSTYPGELYNPDWQNGI
jgi:GWxTD domain-containing protein